MADNLYCSMCGKTLPPPPPELLEQIKKMGQPLTPSFVVCETCLASLEAQRETKH